MQPGFLPSYLEKTLIYWAIFMLMYFAYKFFPNRLLALFCGTTESNFQHYKASFFAWLIASGLEFFLYSTGIPDTETFVYSCIGTAIFLPWFVFLFWYLAPAFYGRMPNIPLEVIYGNIMTLLAGFGAAIFERGLGQIQYFWELKLLLWVLFLVSIALYVVFTFTKLPWADVFVEPSWR